MPVIGLGTFEMDSEYLTLHENVKSAIKHGYRLIGLLPYNYIK